MSVFVHHLGGGGDRERGRSARHPENAKAGCSPGANGLAIATSGRIVYEALNDVFITIKDKQN
jgi:hypothetical protein